MTKSLRLGEGVRPRLIIEVSSPDSRVNDVVTKVDHYYRAGVPYYVIAYQGFHVFNARSLEAFQPEARGYLRTLAAG